MATYPSSVWSGNTRGTNLSDAHTHTKWHDDIMGEVIAIQTELGTNPSGALSTVALRVRQTDSVCQVRMSAAQSITNNLLVILAFNTEDLDPLAWHSTVTNNSRIIPTVAGWYQATLNVNWQVDTDYTAVATTIYKNGSQTTPDCRVAIFANFTSGNPSQSLTSHLISLNGTTDYLEGAAYQTNTGTGANTADAVLTARLVYAT